MLQIKADKVQDAYSLLLQSLLGLWATIYFNKVMIGKQGSHIPCHDGCKAIWFQDAVSRTSNGLSVLIPEMSITTASFYGVVRHLIASMFLMSKNAFIYVRITYTPALYD